MRYLSVCSGIEAASVAWHPLGWRPVAFSEIEDFPSAVLAHRWPEVPNLGDMTNFHDWPTYDNPIDVLAGGTPCQSFSRAGLRKGLDDPRGNLTLTYLAIARRHRPRWLVWENVPGILSDETGGFAALLGGMAELGYGWAYRVLDAQYFGLAQRRQRVFVVGHLGDWRRAAAVLFERQSLRGDPAPSREAGERIAPTLEARARGGGGNWGTDFLAGGGFASTGEISHCLNAGGMGRQDFETETLIAFDPTQITHPENRSNPKPGDPCHTSDMRPLIATAAAVRRLTPLECERLQGFPDGYTQILTPKVRQLEDDLIEYLARQRPDLSRDDLRRLVADTPRYKALGNSMPVPVMRWIGRRIEIADRI